MTWLSTPSGRFDLEHPERYTFRIEEIAHALSNLCRFSGHGLFYSVAEHSVNVSRLLEGDARLFGLLHDAHEPYTGGDIARPVHELSPYIARISSHTQKIIEEQLIGFFPAKIWNIVLSQVDTADIIMLAVEARLVLGVNPRDWGLEVDWDKVDRLTEQVKRGDLNKSGEFGLWPKDAEALFMEEWRTLKQTGEIK